MIRLALPLVLLAASGCAYDRRPEGPRPPRPPQGACADQRLGSLIGKVRSAGVESRAKRLSGARTLRWITPGSAVTMDFRTDRLNLELDERGRITRARCG
ncbi:I78 family peptidase inhibitor [Sphingomonas sp. MMS12-HWE2-04]|uniref:I78 family peptidase inhibitor n=1 Tax=Sphingomonas sp. MMS12-HWE2-04 TaxID=3234199 RepID=UPI00384D81B8